MLVQGVSGVIALGGMDARRARRLRALGSSGWAAIDSLTP
jgi:thiamine-phosphate pyrophosphorylase